MNGHAMLPIFVYGTLKRGQLRAPCWPHPPRLVEPAVTHGQLLDLGPYPGLVPGQHPVLGELWHLEHIHLARTLEVLDRIECFGVDEVDLFVRVVLPCRNLQGETHQAYAYHLAHPPALDAARLIQPASDGYCRWPRD